MPKLSFNPNDISSFKCENCIHSHKIEIGNKTYYECFPVKEDVKTNNSIINCEKFIDYEKEKRDIYIATLIYELYPKFTYKVTPIGCIFRNFEGTDDELWKDLKESNFYDRIKQELPKLGLNREALFEPIIFAERKINNYKWKQINIILNENEAEVIINSLNKGDYDEKQ